MIAKKKFRFSSTGRILICPASKHAPEIPIEDKNDAAAIGHAIHDFLYRAVVFKLKDTRELPESAQKFGVELTDDLYALAWNGLRCLAFVLCQAEPIFAEETLEMRVLDWKGSGHPDLILEDDNGTLIVLDWKTGTPKELHWDQLKMYGLAAYKKFREVGTSANIKLITCYLRGPSEEQIQIRDFPAEEHGEFKADLEYTLSEKEEFTPHPDACQYCPRRGNCVARDEEIRRVSGWLTESNELPSVNVMLQNYEKVKYVKSLCDQFLSSLKARLEESPTPHGGRLYHVEEQPRQKFKLRETIKWIDEISERHGVPYYDAVMAATEGYVTKKQLNEIAKALNMKTSEVMDELKDSNAIETIKSKVIKTTET